MNKTRPLILVVNDDGYEAKGLEAMIEIAKPLGEVAVVVPDRTRSGMGHAITMGEPLRLTNYKNEDGIAYYKTNGTPVDCVKLGEKVVLRNRKIDLLLSGINHGSNASVSLIYSGTMAAAIEAAFDNIPAVGLSVQDYSPNADFTASVHFGRQIVYNNQQPCRRHPGRPDGRRAADLPCGVQADAVDRPRPADRQPERAAGCGPGDQGPP